MKRLRGKRPLDALGQSPQPSNASGSRNAKLFLWFAALGLFAILLASSRVATNLVVQADEGSYLLNAAAIAGKLTRSVLIFKYSSGYSLLLAPAFLLASDFQTVYGIALCINALLIATLPLAFHRIVGAVFAECPERDRVACAIAAALYAPALVLSQYALSDNGLLAAYAWALVAGISALRGGPRLAAIVCGTLLGFLFVIHARGAPLAAPVLVAFALHAVRRPQVRGRVVLIWISAFAAGAMHRPLERFAGKFDGFSAAGPSLRDIVSHFAQAAAWKQALLNTGGTTLVAVVGSAGVILMLAIWALRRFRAAQPFADMSFVVVVACLGSLLACIVTTAVFFTAPTRADHVAYGRYLLPALPPLVALGLASMQSHGVNARGSLAVTLAAGGILAILVTLGIDALPPLDANNWNAVNSVELYVPYKLAGHPLSAPWIAAWYVCTGMIVVGTALTSRRISAAAFAFINLAVAGYMFVDDTVYSRKYYAKDRTIIAAAKQFSASTGDNFCVQVDPALSSWHQVDYRSRLYDQLPESRHSSPCIPARIAKVVLSDPSLGAPPGMIALAIGSTSPAGSFPVALFARDEARTRDFRDHNPFYVTRWQPIPPEQQRAKLRASVRPVMQLAPGVSTTLEVVATNVSDRPWPSHGPYPVRLGVRIRNTDSSTEREDRAEFDSDVDAGESRTLNAPVGPVDEPGRYVVTLGVVQEQVAWFPDSITFELDVKP